MEKIKDVKKVKENIHGVVLLDKPTGMSSNKALQMIKHHFNAKKAGHTGSLDPLATGLLPICLGQATKISEYLLHSHKRYRTVIKLGEVTDTLDRDGEIVSTNEVNISDNDLQTALAQFRGDIKQVPPMYSALKKDGQPLYKLARKGEVIERPARDMTVHSLSAKRLDDLFVELDVHCSSGFYIRSLAHDLGQVLGCGAHVHELRRTHIKSNSIDEAQTLEEILNADLKDVLLPIDTLILEMPKLTLSEQQTLDLSHGRVAFAENQNTQEVSRLYDSSDKLFAIGEVDSNQKIKTKKMFIDI